MVPSPINQSNTFNYAHHSIEKGWIGTKFFSTIDVALIIHTREKGNQKHI